jgi:23S rRNA pseudouridine1911/1915/1917 synthase
MTHAHEEPFMIDLDLELDPSVQGDDPFIDDDPVEDASEEVLGSGTYTFTPDADEKGTRLDKFVADRSPGLSRSYVQQLIDQGLVLVDGRAPKAKFKVTPGQVIQLDVPEPEVIGLELEAIPLDIIFENADVIVINKAPGMVVHPAPGHPRGTLVNALLHHAPEINVGGTNRPGIIHRLDRDTSGLIVVVKTDRARTSLVEQWQARTVEKVYIALAHGELDVEEATVNAPIGRDPKDRKRMATVRGGRQAITHLRVAERLNGATLFDVDLETGRTHQIRVHLAFIGHPIVGDTLYNKYGGRFGGHSESIAPRQFLHAAKLSFTLPGGKRATFTAPLPADLSNTLELAREK